MYITFATWGPCNLTQSVMKETRKSDTDAVVWSQVTYVATGTGEHPLPRFLTTSS